MKAFVHKGTDTFYTTVAEPKVAKGEVKIALKSAGLNHRDLKIPDRRGNINTELILGSDGAGTIEVVGEGVTGFEVGDEVIVNPSIGWYQNSDAPPEGFGIVGMPNHGTFAEKIVISAEQVEKKPEYMSWEEAGVFALSALTGYRALFTKGKLKTTDTVFIPGAGGGVATFMIQFAKAIGARVIVTSRDQKKREKALEIGADVAIDTASDWDEQLQQETIDLVIESVGAATFNRSLSVLKKGGKIVTFGSSTEDNVTINIRQFFYGQYQLLGSTMGSRQEFREMLGLMKDHDIHSEISTSFNLDRAKEAFHYLEHANQFGKVAIKID
ncbi:zinc-binding dehydrogenase [Aquibacillus sediminis]|uniref:zinc-binding dehydrogenase n=1 Tax=Aquibacillus sediminis TaxID=2574734 RepID=UPI0011091F2D|nr:zinc-binding dehydrogenase [Aquibacillus sediminis]